MDLEALGGGRVRLADYRGRVVILNFWTKHCPPCLEEMPSLAELALAVRHRDDIAVVTVCTDDTREEVRQTVSSVLGGPPPFQVLLDPEAQVVTGRFGTQLFPETWLIGPDGIIRARFDGPRRLPKRADSAGVVVVHENGAAQLCLTSVDSRGHRLGHFVILYVVLIGIGHRCSSAKWMT